MIQANKKRAAYMGSRGEAAAASTAASPQSDGPAQYRRAVAHASLGGSRLRLLEHGGVAGHQDGRHRQPAHAVVPAR